MKRFCPYCMYPIQPGTLCSHCGKDPASYQPSSHHFPPDGILRDRYIIGRALGEGGFGITYLGMDTNLERRVAIKEYFPTSFVKREVSVTMDVTCYTAANQDLYEKGRERFLVEARTMAKLDKIPEIVQVLDFFPANNTAYIVMEFLEGSTLKELTAQQGRIPAKDMLDMLEPVLRAMESMHAAGIIHRDISPDNLMVLKSGKVKLMDFGCARDIDGGRTMTTMLKHGFAPREQYSGHGQGPWTDIYALCATVYYCLTGRVPPSSMERDDSDEDPLIPPTRLGAALSPAQESALLKGLAVRAKDRCQSAGSLYAALYGRTMEGYPWTPPADADTEDAGKTEYIHTSGEEDSASQDDTEFSRTAYAPEDDTPGEDHSTEYVKEEPQGPASEEKTKGQKHTSGLLTKWQGLSKQIKVGIGAAACFVVIAGAALALWKPGPSIPAGNMGDDTHQGNITAGPDEMPEQTPEHDPEDTNKLPGITDPQPSASTGAENEAQGETEAPDDNNAPQTGNNTQTTTQKPPQTTTSNPNANHSGTSTPKPQESEPEPTPKPEPTPAPNPTMEELERQAEAALESNQFSQAADHYRQMNSFGYISKSKLAGYLQSVGSDAEYYWSETDYGNNSSPYIKTAFDLYTEAANLGNTLAYSSIAYCYDYGHYVSVNKAKACEWWTKLANTGDGPSCYFVAQYYANGDGVPQDTQKAIEWLNKCFEYGASYVESDARALLDKLQG